MKIAIIGGDSRMLTATRLFKKAGFDCREAALGTPDCIGVSDAVKWADAAVLPMPFEKERFLNAPFAKSKISVKEIFDACGEKTLFIGGGLPKEGKNYIDYSKREDFLLKNAVPTAEGAIEIAIRETDITLWDSRSIVIGYGRIGSVLCDILKGFNSKTTVITRSLQSRARAEISGTRAVGFEDIEAPLSDADIVFNTVPFTVLGENELSFIKPSVPVIDLASLPGGIDESALAGREIKFIRALALPGKTAPVTAGKIIFDTVLSILAERGVAV